MKKIKGFTAVLSMALAFSLVAAPVMSSAAVPNKNQSVDNNTVIESVTKTYLKAQQSEITINIGGKYNLIPKLTKKARDFGFVVTTGGKVGLRTNVAGKEVIVYYPVTWTSANNSYVTVNSKGMITARQVSAKNIMNSYIPTAVRATIPAGAYTNFAGDTVYLENDLFTTYDVTIVPEEDLSVYFLGVWSEDVVDTDAQHVVDYAVNNNNIETQLRIMAQAVTKHCSVKNANFIAYTKTNDGVVRAYFTTHDPIVGTHYYSMAFSTDSQGVNRILVKDRDYCDTEYEYTGTYLRR